MKTVYAKVTPFIPLLIFVAVMLSITVARIGIPFMWAENITLRDSEAIMSTPLNGLWLDELGAWRYLPVCSTLQVPLVKLFGDSPTVPTIFQAVIWGAITTVVYLLVVELTKNKLTGLLSAILLAFSLPAIRESFSTFQTTALVELAIVLGLYGYIRYRNTNQHRWLYLPLACSITGPFIKELAILIPAVILLHIVVESKWDKKFLIPLPFLLFHSIFPSTLPNLFVGKFVLNSVFTRGVPQYYSLFNFQRGLPLSLDMPVHLMLFVTPALILLAVVSIVILLKRRAKTWKALAIMTSMLTAGFASIFFTNIRYGDSITVLSTVPTILCSAIAIISYKYNRFITIWFVIAWVPFFWLYNATDTGLLAPAIPWAIIVAMWLSKLPSIERLIEKGKAFFSPSEVRRVPQHLLVVGLLALGITSQLLNPIAVHRTFDVVDSVTKETANQMPEDGAIITDLIQGMELEYYTDREFELYFVFESHLFPDKYAVPNPDAYDKFLAKHNPIYILASLTLFGGENHWLLTQPGELKELQAKYQAVCRYPVLDPLRCLLPKHYRPTGGPPDRGIEIEISNGLFYQQARVEYALYKLAGETK